MYEIEAILSNETGIHARPASMFVKESSKFKSNIKILKEDKEYIAKSILSILSMGAVKGDTIKICAEGEDEKEAVEALKQLIDSKFGE